MMHEDDPSMEPREPDTGDAALWDRLAARLPQPERPGLWLTEATVQKLEEACPPMPIDVELSARLDDVFRRAEASREFRRVSTSPTLGGYLRFLRESAGLSLPHASGQAGVALQLLGEVEREVSTPQDLGARPLAALLAGLHGSLEQAEELIRAAANSGRWATGSGSLFRGAPAGRVRGGKRASEDSGREREAAERLIDELREAWRDLQSTAR
jgi:hypothetical protein